ncbi:hypothetical protein Tco_0121623 [Tanacetum coccineum]
MGSQRLWRDYHKSSSCQDRRFMEAESCRTKEADRGECAMDGTLEQSRWEQNLERKHMKGKQATLLTFKIFNGGPVALCGSLVVKDYIVWWFACLIAKATTDVNLTKAIRRDVIEFCEVKRVSREGIQQMPELHNKMEMLRKEQDLIDGQARTMLADFIFY